MLVGIWIVKVKDAVGQNPEITRRENARKEEESLRAHMRRAQMVRKNFNVRRPIYVGQYSDDENMPTTSKRRMKKEVPIIGSSSESEDDNADVTRNRGSDTDLDDEKYRKRKQQKKSRFSRVMKIPINFSVLC